MPQPEFPGAAEGDVGLEAELSVWEQVQIRGELSSSSSTILAGDPDTLASGFGGWQADARRARRGCLTGPQTLQKAT